MKIFHSTKFVSRYRLHFAEPSLPSRQPAAILILIWCMYIVSVPLLAGCSTFGAIEIKKGRESIEKRVYDKDNRPDDQVAEHPSVEANTHWDFEFVPEIGIERTKLQKKDSKFTTEVCVKKVRIDLRLPIRVWLPESASPKVIAHENGHVAICRHFYEDAENQAYIASKAILETKFSGCGETESESMQKALEAASLKLVAPFRNAVILPANRASAIYDDLTNHGQADMPVETAVKRAISEAVKNLPQKN